MRLISIQGHFGCIAGEKITFDSGFCRRTLPDGWGKSTLFAFIRVMLYGLNTSRGDTSAVLKNRYTPLDGQSMSGRLTLEYQGRNIVILRTTKRGGPMQDFEAFYEDTGEDCPFLNAKNCGETLLGVSEDVFRSSAYIDGEEMMRPSEELADMIVSLAQSGDAPARGTSAVRRLERWRLDFDSENGVIPKLEAELARIEGLLEDASHIESDLAALEEDNKRIAEEVQRLEAIYEEEYRQNAGEKADEQNRLTILRRESERRIKALRDALPSDAVIQQASDALFGYEGAVQLEREKRERLPPAIMEVRQKLAALDRSEREAEIQNNKRQRPHISWTLIILGLCLAFSAAGSAIFQTNWGDALTGKIPFPYILSALAVISIFFAFLGSVPRREEPDHFDEEREALRAHLKAMEQEQQMAATVLREAYEKLIKRTSEIRPVQTIEEAAEVVRDKRSDLQALRREQDRLQDILYQIQKVIPGDSVNEEGRIRLEEKRSALRAAQKQQQIGLQNAARLQGRKQSLGNQQALTRERIRLQSEIERARARSEDVQLALRVIREEQAALSARLSPTIARLATQFLGTMTGGELSEVQLGEGMTPRAGSGDGQLLDALRLSSEMRDQMYFAFRLAICETLPADEPIPLILDNPFITFDDARTERCESILQELSQHRQVILLTNKSETAPK